MKKIFLFALFLTALACQKKETTKETDKTTTAVNDEHTFSKPDLAVVKHLDLDIKVDFDTQTISGKASWQIDNTSKGNEIIFDENTLTITKVTLGNLSFFLREKAFGHVPGFHVRILREFVLHIMQKLPFLKI